MGDIAVTGSTLLGALFGWLGGYLIGRFNRLWRRVLGYGLSFIVGLLIAHTWVTNEIAWYIYSGAWAVGFVVGAILLRPWRQPRQVGRTVVFDPDDFAEVRRIVSDDNVKVALSLGGGVGPALAGNYAILELLRDIGLLDHVDEIWGTSAGAFVGGAFASGTPLESIKAVLTSLSIGKLIGYGLDINWKGIIFDWHRAEGILTGSFLEKIVKRALSVKEFERCKVKFFCIAEFDGWRGPHVFDRGMVSEAIVASMSMQGIFAPREIGGRKFVDGGNFENVPFRSVIERHLTRDKTKDLFLLLVTHGRQNPAEATRGMVARVYRMHAKTGKQRFEEYLTGVKQDKKIQLSNGRVVDIGPKVLPQYILRLNSEDPEYGVFDFEKIEAKIGDDYVDFGKKLKELNDELRDKRGVAQEARPLPAAAIPILAQFAELVKRDNVERGLAMLGDSGAAVDALSKDALLKEAIKLLISPSNWDRITELARRWQRPIPFLRLAYFYWRSGAIGKAIEVVREGCELAVRQGELARTLLFFKNSLAYYCADDGRPEYENEARTFSEEAVIGRPYEPDPVDTRGYVKIVFGKTAEEILDGVRDCERARDLGGSLDLFIKHTQKAQQRLAELGREERPPQGPATAGSQ